MNAKETSRALCNKNRCVDANDGVRVGLEARAQRCNRRDEVGACITVLPMSDGHTTVITGPHLMPVVTAT
jgi:hypothetical protein